MITFFKWYYQTQTMNFIGMLMGLFGLVSEMFAVQIMFKHITEPLYQDYTWQGRIIGFMVRSGRIILGVIVELIVILFLGVILLLWLFLPLIILGKVFYLLLTVWG
ncbi:hypothetical protein KJ855_00950 [Patescibacteria group bacterium]|nr:hypothetical protein [Patescibacteria group bacterium]